MPDPRDPTRPTDPRGPAVGPSDDSPGEVSPLADRLPGLRRVYDVGRLDDDHLDPDPYAVFHRWFDAAETEGEREPNAMVLATVDLDGYPDARTVLLKGLDERGFVFFTNYTSAKGHQLAAEPRAALVFRWAVLERQVRVRGVVAKVSAAESDAYFTTRPEGSRYGAAASPQSHVIPSRSVLEEAVDALRARHPDGDVPRPAHWGGYRLHPEQIEFWQGRTDRLHDRFRYTRDATGWHRVRLAP